MLRARDCNSRPVRGAPRGLEELCARPPTAPLHCYTYAARYAGEVAAERKACAYVRIRQHTCAGVRIRQHTCACGGGAQSLRIRAHTSKYVRIRQNTCAYVSIRAHAPAYDSGMQGNWPQLRAQTVPQAYVSRRQHMSTYLP